MKIHICAVGRLRASSELDLITDYLARFDKTGRQLGIGPAVIHEAEPRKGTGKQVEAEALQKLIPKGAMICTLDERGRELASPKFANLLETWRDQGHGSAAFVIGGADGLAEDFVAKADLSLSLGKMVWPHMLVRVMLAEQLYRAASILANFPYHRA